MSWLQDCLRQTRRWTFSPIRPSRYATKSSDGHLRIYADDPGWCGDLGTLDHAGTATRGYCQGQGQVQGAQAEARADAGEDQGAVGYWRDACADREEPEGGSIVCVSRGSWASRC